MSQYSPAVLNLSSIEGIRELRLGGGGGGFFNFFFFLFFIEILFLFIKKILTKK